MNARILMLAAVMFSSAKAPEPRVLLFAFPKGAEKSIVETSKGKFQIVSSHDPAELTGEKLAAFKAVLFYAVGEPPIDRGAMRDYLKNGGGLVSVSSAADDASWKGKLKIKVEDRGHPATIPLGESWEIEDDVHPGAKLDRTKVHVLLSGNDAPLAWTMEVGRGRVFHTAFGHREQVWADARFRAHLLGGIAWAAGMPDIVAAPPKLQVDAEGFEVLFDGKNANGWCHAGLGGFTVADGFARPYGGMGLWYYERKKYRNFMLKLEFRQKSISSNSGVYIRFPRVEGDPWLPVYEGYEIQVSGDKPSTHTTGSIYSFQAPTEIPLKAVGEWNEYEIASVGQQIWVRLNGRLINTYKGDRGLTGGMIGVQNHDDDNTKKQIVDYRNIRARELPEAAAGYHVLSDGTDVKTGALTWERPLKNFVLMFDWKGEGIRIVVGSGAIALPAADDWSHGEVAVLGRRATLRVNGKIVKDSTSDRDVEGLLSFDTQAPASLRNARLVTLR